MRFLLPSGGTIPDGFGVLTAPNHRGIPAGIVAGKAWAADLGCIDGPDYVKRYKPDKTAQWLDLMIGFRDTCLFIPAPDYVGDARKTLKAFAPFRYWPTAFVAQDGQEDLDFPQDDLWVALFVGGTTKWKMSNSAIECIQRAQALGKHIHIGRVNYFRRFQHFASLPGSESFTCDGTRIRYGRDKAIEDWTDYMERPKQYNLFVPGGDSIG